MIWNFEQEPYDEPPDETSLSLRGYLDRMSEEQLAEYRSDWSDDQVMHWERNFRDDGTLFLVCCERDVDVAEYRKELEACIHYRGRVKAGVGA
jgi:hypothetical protein